jgi:arabinofuranosyltransferase
MRNRVRLIYAVVLGSFAIHSLSYYRMKVDDAYITFRYADNFARGFGLVFNPGERVEGYSNFTLVLLLAPFVRLAADLLIVSKVIGFISGLIAVIYTIRLSSLYGGSSFFRFVPGFMLATSASFALWSMAGIETDFYCMLLVAGTYYYIRWQHSIAPLSDHGDHGAFTPFLRSGPWDHIISGILLSLAAMSRPEGAIFGIALGFDAVITIVRGRRLSSRDLAWAACFGLPFGLFLSWRLWYYGFLLPNTYYAKMGGGIALRLKSLRYGYEFIMVNGGGLLIALIAVALLVRGVRRYRPVLFFLAANAFFVINAGNDWMPMHRFFVPSLPMVFLLASEGMRAIYEKSSALQDDVVRSKFMPIQKTMAGLLILGLAAFAYAEERHSSGATRSGYRHTGEHAIAAWLMENTRPDSTLAIDAAGIIPYYTRLYSLDYLGICDSHIARMPGFLHEKSDPDYVLSKRLDYVVMCGAEKNVTQQQIANYDIPGMRRPEDDLMRHPIFRVEYEFAALVRMENGSGIIWRRKEAKTSQRAW